MRLFFVCCTGTHSGMTIKPIKQSLRVLDGGLRHTLRILHSEYDLFCYIESYTIGFPYFAFLKLTQQDKYEAL